MGKLLGVLAAVFFFFVLIRPRAIPALARRLGRSVRTAWRTGRELAGGEEDAESPLRKLEVQAGRILLEKSLLATPPAADRALQERVTVLGAEIARAARRRGIPYRFYAVEDPVPNAFALPGGAVLITRGMVELCGEDDDELGGVLAHEIAHIDRRHAVREAAARLAVQAGSRLLLRGGGLALGRLVGALEEIAVRGYHRDRELEADAVGAALLLAAGRDPMALARLLARLASARSESEHPLAHVIDYFRTHPPVEERIRALEARFGKKARAGKPSPP